MKYQIATRGYSHRDIYNYSDENAKKQAMLFDELSKKTTGHPMSFRAYSHESLDKTYQRWVRTLEKIRDGWKAVSEINELQLTDYKEYRKKVKQLDAKFNKAMLLYAKYYGCFWY